MPAGLQGSPGPRGEPGKTAHCVFSSSPRFEYFPLGRGNPRTPSAPLALGCTPARKGGVVQICGRGPSAQGWGLKLWPIAFCAVR